MPCRLSSVVHDGIDRIADHRFPDPVPGWRDRLFKSKEEASRLAC